MQPFSQSVRGHNHLFGFQLGTVVHIWEQENRFRIEGLVKAGMYDNAAAQANNFSDPSGPLNAAASTVQASFLGEVGILGSYQFTPHLAVRGGCQWIWLDGLALAPGQIGTSDFGTATAHVNTAGCLGYHGANAGIELTW